MRASATPRRTCQPIGGEVYHLGLVVPMPAREGQVGKAYLLGLGNKSAAFDTQRRLLERLDGTLQVREVRAQVTENCTVVSVIASRFRGVPGVMALVLENLASANVPHA